MNEELNQPAKDAEYDSIACANCSQSNELFANFCVKCGAPLSSLSTVCPFQTTLMEGFAYRQAVSGPPRKIILFGMWFMFAPLLILSWFSLCWTIWLASSNGFVQECIGMFICTFLFGLVSAVLLFRTTRNYIRNKRMVV